MKIEILNDKKKDFGYVKKISIRFTSGNVVIEEPLTIQQFTELYFTIGKICQEYWSQKQ